MNVTSNFKMCDMYVTLEHPALNLKKVEIF